MNKQNYIQFKTSDIEIIDWDRWENYPSENDFFDKGYCLFLDSWNVSQEGFDFSNTHFITKEKDLKLRNGKLKRNDIVLTTRWSVWNIALYDDSVPFENVRINSWMVIIRCKNDFTTKYIYYLLQSKFIKKQISNIMSWSVQNQLPISVIKDLILIKEDWINIEILSKIDDQINRNKDMVQKLQVLGKTIFEKMYHNQLLDYNWKLKDICKLPSWYSFKASDYNENWIYKLITIKNVSETFVNTDKTDRLGTIPQDVKDYCKLKIWDILLSLTWNVWRISINTENNCLLNQRVSIMSCITEYKFYVYYLLMCDYYQILMQKLARWTSQKNLSPIDVENLNIFYPKDNINQFNKIVLPLFNQMAQTNISTNNLINLKNKLLPLLINGQLQ